MESGQEYMKAESASIDNTVPDCLICCFLCCDGAGGGTVHHRVLGRGTVVVGRQVPHLVRLGLM